MPEKIYNMAAQLLNYASDLNKCSTAYITTRASYLVKRAMKAHHACRKILELARDQHVDQVLAASITIHHWYMILHSDI